MIFEWTWNANLFLGGEVGFGRSWVVFINGRKQGQGERVENRASGKWPVSLYYLNSHYSFPKISKKKKKTSGRIVICLSFYSIKNYRIG